MRSQLLVSLVISLVLVVPAAPAAELTAKTFGGMSARAVGPAAMSGRIAAIDAVPGPPLTIYVGAASGGVWRSQDGGTVFEPVFDKHPQSIGAIRIDPSDPNTVWVGTGETWVRNSVSVGDGIYRSRDGGETWQHLGLADSERIAKIVVDSTDSDIVHVCATGHLWNGNQERGVFRTDDGGTSWEKVLYLDQDTGCADLDIDPQDPSILYAAMWQFRRSPYSFSSGGPGSGLYRSRDRGLSWERLSKGLPAGELGRIATAVAPARPSVVYALVESEASALYRSINLGESWTEMSTASLVKTRPFYFSELIVDPLDFNRIYKPGSTLSMSANGGKAFVAPMGLSFSVHPDHHALWINPDNPQQMLLGTDGGLYISEDRGRHWRFVRGLPISQPYHVSHDLQWPYNLYCGLQDNGSWRGPSRHSGGIRNRDWDRVGVGDGFWVFADPEYPDIVYVEYQGGEISRINLAIGESKSIKPPDGEGSHRLRFNWNTPIHLSPSTPGTIYLGSQYLHRSHDRGESWQHISPDLTTNDPDKQQQHQSGGLTIDNTTAENHCTIYTISESPVNPDLIWVGTDDGLLHVTDDSGATWSNVISNVPQLPANTWVSSICASPHDESAALVTFDGHRTGDMQSYAYLTSDLGTSWTRLDSTGIEGWAYIIRQDPVNPDLLYLGTEMGLYISIDRGAGWARFTANLPARVSVRDLVIHPSEHDLIIATHGRGIYIIDDLTPLRHLTPEIIDAEVALLPSRPSVMMISGIAGDRGADDEFTGANPAEVASITYYQKKRHLFGDLRLEIYSSDGELITTLPGRKRPGLNRVEWPMRLKPPKLPPATSLVPAFAGPKVAEGTYQVKLIKGKQTVTGEVSLVADPRSPYSAEDRTLQQQTAMAIYNLLTELSFSVDQLTDLRAQATAQQRQSGKAKRLQGRLESLRSTLDELHQQLVATSSGQGFIREERLRERIGALYGAVSSYDGRPTQSQLQHLAKLSDELAIATTKLEQLVAGAVAEINRALEARKLEPLVLLTREQWDQDQAG